MNFDENQQKSSDEFDIFLSKIEKIGSIISDISSSDSNISKKGIEKADEYLSSLKKEDSLGDEDGNVVRFSKTSLNKKAMEGNKELDYSNLSTDAFMAAVEKDANERYIRRFK